MADQPTRQDFDAVVDELRKELRDRLKKAPRYDQARYDDAVYIEPNINVMQRFEPALDAATLADRTRDVSLLYDLVGNKLETVTIETAAEYAGVSVRQIRRLIRKDNKLIAVGGKGNRRVTTESLLAFFPLKK